MVHCQVMGSVPCALAVKVTVLPVSAATACGCWLKTGACGVTVSTAASLEFGFATPSYLICEAVHLDVPWRGDIVSEGFTVEPKGRLVRPSSRPGLGIEIDEAEVKKHPFEQEIHGSKSRSGK